MSIAGIVFVLWSSLVFERVGEVWFVLIRLRQACFDAIL